MFYVLMFEFMLLGVIGGLLGIFYRNCLKVEDMIFYPLYSKVFVPIEVIVTSAIFFNARELMSIIEVLKHALRIKMVEELKEKADKGEATVRDAMAALMLAAIMKKESEED